jgi:hypothetical protein
VLAACAAREPPLERPAPSPLPAPLASRPPADAAPRAVDAASDAQLAAASEPDLGPAFERVSLPSDPAATSDAIFQLHVETGGAYLPPALRTGIAPDDAVMLSGEWPRAAWASVRHIDPNVAVSAETGLYRWLDNRWVSVPRTLENDRVDYALGAWTNGNALAFRGELRGGNAQSFVIPKPFSVDASGKRFAPPRAARDFVARRIAVSASGELFVAGHTPPASVGDTNSQRPAIARWDAAGAHLGVDRLPTEHGKQKHVWLSDAHVDALCALSSKSALAVGSETSNADSHPRPAIWRFDGSAWKLEKLAGGERIWGIGCTPDGAVWLGAERRLERRAPGDTRVIELQAPSTDLGLVTTRLGDVFVIAGGPKATIHRLRR